MGPHCTQQYKYNAESAGRKSPPSCTVSCNKQQPTSCCTKPHKARKHRQFDKETGAEQTRWYMQISRPFFGCHTKSRVVSRKYPGPFSDVTQKAGLCHTNIPVLFRMSRKKPGCITQTSKLFALIFTIFFAELLYYCRVYTFIVSLLSFSLY